MPVQRVSKSFKDISMSFQVNPLTDDLIVLKNETAIARSIRNLVLTLRGEKFFQPNLGSNVQQILFDQVDYASASTIEDAVRHVINNYEPRVRIMSIKVTPNFDNGEMDVVTKYKIVGIDAEPQQLSFALQPTR